MLALGLYLWSFVLDFGSLLTLSYTYLMVQAILWASFFDRPYIFFLAYAVVVIRGLGAELLVSGDWIGGAVIVGVALYLWHEPTPRSRNPRERRARRSASTRRQEPLD
jgi:hypothetical protein